MAWTLPLKLHREMKKILMAECEPEMSAALVSFVGEKYQVYMVNSREDALEHLRHKEIDLLIVDDNFSSKCK